MALQSALLRYTFSVSLALGTCCAAEAQPSIFTIHVNDDVVGQVRVSRGMVGTRMIYSMVSLSEVMVVWPR